MNGFVENQARLSFLITSLLFNGFAAFRLPLTSKKKESYKRHLERQHIVTVLLQIISLLLVLSAPFSDRRNIMLMDLPDVIRFIGIGFYITGFTYMQLAELHLGRQFSVEVMIRENHKLITDGPYKYIRHPRYSGVILFTVGFSLIFNSWIAFILLLVLIVILVWRINDEEKLLHEEFNIKWEAYKKNTWRLIPFLF